MDGKGDVVTGWQNKLRSAIANVTSGRRLAESIAAWRSPAREGSRRVRL